MNTLDQDSTVAISEAANAALTAANDKARAIEREAMKQYRPIVIEAYDEAIKAWNYPQPENINKLAQLHLARGVERSLSNDHPGSIEDLKRAMEILHIPRTPGRAGIPQDVRDIVEKVIWWISSARCRDEQYKELLADCAEFEKQHPRLDYMFNDTRRMANSKIEDPECHWVPSFK